MAISMWCLLPCALKLHTNSVNPLKIYILLGIFQTLCECLWALLRLQVNNPHIIIIISYFQPPSTQNVHFYVCMGKFIANFFVNILLLLLYIHILVCILVSSWTFCVYDGIVCTPATWNSHFPLYTWYYVLLQGWFYLYILDCGYFKLLHPF